MEYRGLPPFQMQPVEDIVWLQKITWYQPDGRKARCKEWED